MKKAILKTTELGIIGNGHAKSMLTLAMLSTLANAPKPVLGYNCDEDTANELERGIKLIPYKSSESWTMPTIIVPDKNTFSKKGGSPKEWGQSRKGKKR